MLRNLEPTITHPSLHLAPFRTRILSSTQILWHRSRHDSACTGQELPNCSGSRHDVLLRDRGKADVENLQVPLRFEQRLDGSAARPFSCVEIHGELLDLRNAMDMREHVLERQREGVHTANGLVCHVQRLQLGEGVPDFGKEVWVLRVDHERALALRRGFALVRMMRKTNFVSVWHHLPGLKLVMKASKSAVWYKVQRFAVDTILAGRTRLGYFSASVHQA